MSDVFGVAEDVYNFSQVTNPLSDSYNPGSVIPEQAQLPGMMGMLTSPGFEQATRATNPLTLGGFAAFRSQNTLMRGGVGDDAGRVKQALRRGRGKFSNYAKGSLLPDVARGPNQFVGGTNIIGRPTRRGNRLLAKANKINPRTGLATGGKTPLVKSFLKNNFTLNPQRFFRKQGLSEFLSGPGRNFYSPNSGGFLASIGNIGANPSNPRFSGGVLGRMGALTKTERMSRAGKSTAKMDMNLARILSFNNPSMMHAAGAFPVLPGTSPALTGLGMSLTGAAGATPLEAGARRYAMTEGIRGTRTKSLMSSILTVGGGEEMFTGMGTAAARSLGGAGGTMVMTEAAEKLMKPLSKTILSNSSFQARTLSALGGGAFVGAVPMTEFGAAQLSKQLIQKGFIETLGYKGAAHAAVAGGGRVAGAVAGQALLRAVPGLNMIFAADLAYQLAKLGGMAVKGAINFGKDAMKSMQGNINGGMFGTYKDDEVRATSRARGVSAIQNSRINARSLLGSEGAMMAAHFG